MIDENSGFAIERELQVKKIKRILDNWRELSLLVNSILLWKKKLYPWAIAAATTLIFAEFAYYNPPFLTTVGILSALVCTLDYLGPRLSGSVIWYRDDWNAAKEREFEEVCRSIAGIIVYIKQYWACAKEIKATRPYVYFSTTISASCLLSFLGNSVNNILLLYFLFLWLLMLPGLVHYGILQKYYSLGLSYFVTIIRSFGSSSAKTKTQ